MANKSAIVSARIQPEIKEKAEIILDQLGLSISTVIDALYRQIIITGGVPFSLSLPKMPSLDWMSREEFLAAIERGLGEAREGNGLPLDEAFDEINKVL